MDNNYSTTTICIRYFVLLVLFLNFSYAWDEKGRCETLSSTSVCNSILGTNQTNIYLKSDQNQTAIEASFSYFFGITSAAGPDCAPYLQKLLCSYNYPQCVIVNSTTPTIYLPSLLCQGDCKITEQICSAFVALFPPEYLCSNKSSDGLPSYPDSSTIYDLQAFGGPSNETIQCSHYSTQAQPATLQCPHPLLNVSYQQQKDQPAYFSLYEIDPESSCVVPCPMQISTKREVDAMYISKVVLYFLSFTGSVILFITFGLLTKKYSKKYEIILSFTFSTVIVDISFFLELSKPDLQFVCGDEPGRYITQTDVRCGFSGFLFHWGTMATLFWWAFLCYDFYLTSKIKKNVYFKYFRIGLWFLSLLFALIPLMGKAYNSSIISYGCWIYSNTNTDAWQYGLYYVPAWIVLFIIFCFTVYSIVNVVKMYKHYPNVNIAIYNIKMVFLMLYLLFTITYNSFFKFYLNEDSYTQLLLDWVVCLTTASDSKSCILHLPGFIYRYIGLISTAATGFVSFLVYAIDINTFNIWRESTPVRYILRKCGVSSSGSSSSSTNKSNSRRSRGQSLGPKMNHRMSILQTQNSSTDSQSSNITTPDTQGSTVLSIAASGDSIDSTPRNASEQQT